VHHGDATRERRRRVPARDLLVEDLKIARGARIIAAGDLADGRLAGAVLADQPMDLALAELRSTSTPEKDLPTSIRRMQVSRGSVISPAPRDREPRLLP
jgi:hypothetical protein